MLSQRFAPITELRGVGGAGHYTYYAGDWPAMEYHLGERLFAGVFPTNNGEACIWVCSPADDALRLRRSHDTIDAAFDTMLRAAAPELADRISANATRTSPVRGMIGMPNPGHGISDAFRDADLLATALGLVLRGDADEATALSGYHAERDSQLREIFEITCALSKFPPAHHFIELQRQLSAAMDNRRHRQETATRTTRRLPPTGWPRVARQRSQAHTRRRPRTSPRRPGPAPLRLPPAGA